MRKDIIFLIVLVLSLLMIDGCTLLKTNSNECNVNYVTEIKGYNVHDELEVDFNDNSKQNNVNNQFYLDDEKGHFDREYALEEKNYNNYFIAIGQNIRFGNYLWKVLDIKDDMALVITEDVVSESMYDNTDDVVTWENCLLREWLNEDFYNGFSETEKNKIIQSKLQNKDDEEYGTEGGNDTYDKIFLLSYEEAQKYFADDNSRKANLNGNVACWWLRTPGYQKGEAIRVDFSGGYFWNVYDTYPEISGVRPAMWIYY